MSTPEDKLRLGGMALRNGLLVHGPTHWAAAVRDPAGRDQGGARAPSRDLGGRASEAIPGVRGITKLAEAMAVIPLVKRDAARGPAADAGRPHAGRDGRRGAARPGHPLHGRAHGGPRGGRGPGEPRARAAGAARRRPGRLPRRGAQGDRRLRAGRRGRRRRQGARPLRLEPGRADAGERGGGQRRRAQGRAAAGRRPRPRVALGSAAVAVEVFAWSERHEGTAPRRALRKPGLRDPARWWARASPARSSSRWAARRWPRSCAWSHAPKRTDGRARRPRAPGAGGLPAAGRAHPRGLLLRRLLQLHQRAAGGARTATRAC